jgi:tellurite resistance protein TerA
MPIDYNKRPSKNAAPAASAAPASGPISLTKRGQQVNLKKGGSGPVRINLNWTQQPAQNAGAGGGGGGGMLKRALAKAAAGAGGGGIDLDLGCLVEMADGSKGAVQALGNSFGSLDQPPWVKLDKDDRSGTSTDGENLFVSEKHSADIKRLAVFAFIYQGAKNWSQANAKVTIHPPSGETVTIDLDETRDGVGMCSICLIHGGPNGFTVQREVQYVSDHRELDKLYGWEMNWTRGSK